MTRKMTGGGLNKGFNCKRQERQAGKFLCEIGKEAMIMMIITVVAAAAAAISSNQSFNQSTA
jgi:hypothetical protein